ncbi:MAG: DUF1858 domain-containing protein [candidate division Zixibacteria bacterium]|nr:DUF1858 domain-containing protein [candidate division Zixibacteria bacterium]
MPGTIDADRPIDHLVREYPGLVKFLIDHNLPCVVCGEPFWGSLRELAHQKGMDDQQVQRLVEEFANRH